MAPSAEQPSAVPTSASWDNWGAAYSAEWRPPAKQSLSTRELDFVGRHLDLTAGRRALDVGIGNGRILGYLLERSPKTSFYGIDFAPAMVEVCAERFRDEPRVEGLFVCDVSREAIPVEGPLDFVSAIRMLKYSDNWREMVAKLRALLAPGGVIVFTMSNDRSLSRYSRKNPPGSPIRDVSGTRASAQDLRGLCADLELEVLAMTGFTKVPYFFYNRPQSELVAKAVVTLDRSLDRLLGPVTLAREIFVAARAPTEGRHQNASGR